MLRAGYWDLGAAWAEIGTLERTLHSESRRNANLCAYRPQLTFSLWSELGGYALVTGHTVKRP